MITALMRCLLALLVAATVLTQVRLIRNLNRDGENSLTEGETLYALEAVQNRQPLYHDFSHPPYVLTQYTPLFYFVPGLLTRWLETGTLATFAIGRSYAYGCWLGVTALIYLLARQRGCNRGPAVLAALVFLTAPLATGWANSYRPDSAALLFSLAAVLVYDGGKRLPITVLLLAIAFLHKQSAVVALLVIGLEELRSRHWLRAVAIATGWLAIVATTMVLMQWWSDGAFMMNCFGSLAQMHNWRWPLYLLGAALLLGAAGFAGGLMTLGVPSASLLKRYFVLSLIFAFLSSAKFGSWTNYYIEPFAVVCVLTAVGLGQGAQHRLRQFAWLVVALGVTVEVMHSAMRPSDSALPRDWKSLGAWGRPLLIEDVYVAARLDGEPYMLNPGIFARLEHSGRFDSSSLRRAIEQKKFAAIICKRPLDDPDESRPFSSGWRKLMQRYYSLVGQIDTNMPAETLWVYRP